MPSDKGGWDSINSSREEYNQKLSEGENLKKINYFLDQISIHKNNIKKLESQFNFELIDKTDTENHDEQRHVHSLLHSLGTDPIEVLLKKERQEIENIHTELRKLS